MNFTHCIVKYKVCVEITAVRVVVSIFFLSYILR